MGKNKKNRKRSREAQAANQSQNQDNVNAQKKRKIDSEPVVVGESDKPVLSSLLQRMKNNLSKPTAQAQTDSNENTKNDKTASDNVKAEANNAKAEANNEKSVPNGNASDSKPKGKEESILNETKPQRRKRKKRERKEKEQAQQKRNIDASANNQAQQQGQKKKKNGGNLLCIDDDAFQASSFRITNEELYTTRGSEQLTQFELNPKLFYVYHKGFAHQTSKWEASPVKIITDWLSRAIREKFTVYKRKYNDLQKKSSKMGEEKCKKLMKKNGFDSNFSVQLADLGCGEAALGKEMVEFAKKCNDKAKLQLKKKVEGPAEKNQMKELAAVIDLEMHNFDLIEDPVRNIKKQNINEKIPLESDSCDYAIFSLALMGTDLTDQVKEQHRVLRRKSNKYDAGVLFVAEVVSRVDKLNGIGGFLEQMEDLGFKAIKFGENSGGYGGKSKKGKGHLGNKQNVDDKILFANSHFFVCAFEKADLVDYGNSAKTKLQMDPCVYKRR